MLDCIRILTTKAIIRHDIKLKIKINIKNHVIYDYHFVFVSGYIQVRQNLMSTNSSTIDLTDEDEARPQRGNAPNGPPALVALNVRRPQQLVSVQQQQPPQQRQLITAQQTIRNTAALVTQTRKLPIIGKQYDLRKKTFVFSLSLSLYNFF